MRYLSFTLLIFVAACTSLCKQGRREMRPEEVVEKYLNTALNMSNVTQRVELLEYTTGNLHAAISEVSDETIQKAYVDRKYQLDRYSFIERRDRTPRETEVTFQLVYKDLSEAPDQDPEKSALITTENTVRVVREKDAWFVSDVLGKKTSIEFPDLKEMEIRAKAGG